mgnify:FL=1
MNKIKSKNRFASIWFPQLPLEAILSKEPLLDSLPLVVSFSDGEEIICANELAKKLNIRPKMSTKEVLTLNPHVVSKKVQHSDLKKKLIKLFSFTYQFTPLIRLDGYDSLMLDITGCEKFTGKEEEFIHQLTTHFSKINILSIVGIAGTQGAAWAAARFQNNSNIKQPRVNLRKIINDQSRATRIKIPSDRVNKNSQKKLSIFNTSYSLNNPIYRSRIIDNDKTEKALISLPVEALNLESTDVNLLNLFGIYKVGDLISIDSSSINRRFGNHIIKRVRQVLGKETELFNKIVWKQKYLFSTQLFLEEVTFQGISECIKALIKNLCDKLEKNKKLIRRCKIKFSPNHKLLVEINFSNPTQDRKKIELVVLEKLKTIKSLKNIEEITLEGVHIEGAKERQIAINVAGANHTYKYLAKEETMSLLMARIEARLGKNKVKSFVQHHSHIPEKTFSLDEFKTKRKTGNQWQKSKFIRPILLYSPDLINATLYRDDYLNKFSWRGKKYKTCYVRGPERIASEWWNKDKGTNFRLRDYWEVTTTCGARLWMFEEKNKISENRWFVHGNFC